MTRHSILIAGDVAHVPLTQGYMATVDALDLDIVAGFKWYANVVRLANGAIRTAYAQRPGGTGEPKVVLMHRAILLAPGLEVDHINGDGMDNRRSNLRAANKAQNSQNRRRGSNNSSGVKGVNRCKQTGLWICRIVANGQRRHVGRFANLEAAQLAYAEASKEMHGEFGRLE